MLRAPLTYEGCMWASNGQYRCPPTHHCLQAPPPPPQQQQQHAANGARADPHYVVRELFTQTNVLSPEMEKSVVDIVSKTRSAAETRSARPRPLILQN
jgi:hypothetical protein